MDTTGTWGAATAGPKRPLKYVARWSDLILLGIFVRLALSAISAGTDDVGIWRRFGERIDTDGIVHLYRTDPGFNHPPLPAYWAMLVFQFTRYHPGSFPPVFRIPGIIADAFTCLLLYWIGKRRAMRAATGFPGFMSVAFAWSPVAILMAGHHGSTDSIYASLCLLAAYCAQELSSPFKCGLALGAAINIKLIPVLLIVPFLTRFRSRAQAAGFIAGLAIMAIPFLPVLIACGSAFHRNAMDYNSAIDYWGIDQILLQAQSVDKYAGLGVILLAEYYSVGRYVIWASVFALALIAARKQLDFYTIGAGAAALFLIFTPGFGVQYLIFVLPLLLAADLKIGLLFSLLAGGFMFIAYELFWDGTYPIETVGISVRVHRGPGETLAALAWATLICFVYRSVARHFGQIPVARAHIPV